MLLQKIGTPKYQIIFALIVILLLFNICVSRANNIIKGEITYNNFGTIIAIEEARISIAGSTIGAYSDKTGKFIINDINIPKDGELIVTKFNFIPIMKEFKLDDNNEINVLLMPSYEYFITPPLTGDELTSQPVRIYGKVFEKNKKSNPLSNVLIRLIDSPYSAYTDINGLFNLYLTIDEISMSSNSKVVLFIDKPGFDLEIVSFSKTEILRSFEKNNFEFNCGTIYIQKYIMPSDLAKAVENIFIDIQNDTAFFTNIVKRINNENVLEQIKALVERYESDSILVKKKLDSLMLINNVQDSILQLNDFFKLYIQMSQLLKERIDNQKTEIDSLKQNIKRDSLKFINSYNRFSTDIRDFNENAQILKDTYFNRIVQFDTTFLQLLCTFPMTVMGRYPEFVTTFPIGQIGISSNFGIKKLIKSGIYFNLTYTNLTYTSDSLFLQETGDNINNSMKSINPGYLSFSINLRPPVDLIKNLKIDPGFGIAYGYDFKKMNTLEINDSTPHWSLQPLVQITILYKLFTPYKEYYLIDTDETKIKSVDNSQKIKIKGKLPDKYLKSFFHSLYLYGTISDRLVFHDKKFQYGMTYFGIGFKWDIVSFFKNNVDIKIEKNKFEYLLKWH